MISLSSKNKNDTLALIVILRNKLLMFMQTQSQYCLFSFPHPPPPKKYNGIFLSLAQKLQNKTQSIMSFTTESVPTDTHKYLEFVTA